MADAGSAPAKRMWCSVPERLQLHGAMLALQFGYAGFHVVSRAALNMGISKLVFPVYRNIIALLLLLPFAYFLEKKERPALTLNFLVQFFLLALVGITANQGFYLLGLDNTSPTFASAIQNSVPAITFLMAALLRIEKVRLDRKDGIGKVVGTIFCVAGATVITLYKGPTIYGPGAPPVLHNTTPALVSLGDANGKNWTLGCLYLIGHCLSWSGWLVLQSPVLKKYPARLSVTSYTCFFGLIQFVVIALIFERDAQAWMFHSGGEVFTILYAGVVASGVAFAVQIWCIDRGGPVFVAVYQPVQTLVVAIMASIALGEEFYLGGIIGAVLIIVGLYLVLWGKSEERKFAQEKVAILATPEQGNNRATSHVKSSLTQRKPFSLPAPIPKWPGGGSFASGKINLGELEVVEISRFELIWNYNQGPQEKKGVTFYKPLGIPDGFYCLGHYCQPNSQPLRGFVLVAREVGTTHASDPDKPPALLEPVDYSLVWTPDDGSEEKYGGSGYVWLPQPPGGYKSTGYLVTNTPNKPELDEVRCVRADLTDKCEIYHLILDAISKFPNIPFRVWDTRPHYRGMLGRGVPVGTFFCSSYWGAVAELPIACLKNLNPTLPAMPNHDQVHALIHHYGPTVFFHPAEIFLPSSITWFFKNGALLYRAGILYGEPIEANGSNLPGGGRNDRKFWIDLPADDRRESVKLGNLESAKLYIHVKPALGGTFTDIAMWVFCPFNGPATLKIGLVNIALTKIGEHVGDWEHFTLRISNFTGELWSIYFAQHSSGEWVDAYDLEYIEGNKAIVYSSKSGHASYPHPGNYLQGSTKLGIGVRNDCARSNLYVDSSVHYQLVAAEYLGHGVVTEPFWLQFMRDWGPTIIYESRIELDKIINLLPVMLRYSVENIFDKLPLELYGEAGPTGPKEKKNWVGDEKD